MKTTKSTAPIIWHNFGEAKFEQVAGRFSTQERQLLNMSESQILQKAKAFVRNHAVTKRELAITIGYTIGFAVTVVGLPVVWLPLKLAYDDYKENLRDAVANLTADQYELRERAIKYMDNLEGTGQGTVVKRYTEGKLLMPQDRGRMKIEDRHLAPQVMLRSIEMATHEKKHFETIAN